MFKRILAAGLLVAGMISTANAELYKFDRSHTNIGFSVKHMAITRVKGNFTDFAGTVEFDEADPTKSVVDLTIQTASINTNNENRDNDLKSPGFFAADSFPTITFKSTKIVAKGQDKYDITGDLTMRGVTKPITLATELVGKMEDARMGKRMGFSANTTINRQDWGISWSHALDSGGLVVSNDVDLLIDVELAIPRKQ